MVRRSSDWAVRIDRAFLMESLQHCCDEKVSITGEKMPLQWGERLAYSEPSVGRRIYRFVGRCCGWLLCGESEILWDGYRTCYRQS